MQRIQPPSPAKLAQSAQIAYDDDPGDGLKAIGLDLVRRYDVKGTQAYLALTEGGGRLVAFRGTERDWKDILTDIDARMTATPFGAVHAGFDRALGQVWIELKADLKSMTGPIRFIGHSLGAALATLAAARARLAGVDTVVGVTTFGSPRVLAAEAVGVLAGVPIWRYVNCCDVVAKVPTPVRGFRHVGTLGYIDRNGRLFPDPPLPYCWTDQAAAIAGHWAGNGERGPDVGRLAALSFIHHRMQGYVDALGAIERAGMPS